MSEIINYLEKHSGLFSALAAIVTILTVVGGWIIAYYRRRPETPSRESHSRSKDQTKKLLIKKWIVSEAEIGEKSVEFTSDGKVIRIFRPVLLLGQSGRGVVTFNDEVTHFPFQITEEGELKCDQLKLVSVSPNQLVLSWNGTVVHYSPENNKAHILADAILGPLVLLGFVACCTGFPGCIIGIIK